ncbi:MAG: hypothetical protein HGA45_10600 [Chloroflexales bacterium]|nr:hypothetical protein [Chloroflexales bacterium]
MANPGDLDRYNLPPIDVEAQISQVRGALSAFDLTILDGREGRPHATPATLIEHLAQGYHVIYIICVQAGVELTQIADGELTHP